jgi:ribosomal protein L37AE/L43A
MTNPGHANYGRALSRATMQRINSRAREGPICKHCGSLLPSYRHEIGICIDCECRLTETKQEENDGR